jgi:hypothetical protein
MDFAYSLMMAGALLVVVGFIGVGLRRNVLHSNGANLNIDMWMSAPPGGRQPGTSPSHTKGEACSAVIMRSTAAFRLRRYDKKLLTPTVARGQMSAISF